MDATNPQSQVTDGTSTDETLQAVLAERNRLWADAREVDSLRLELQYSRAIIDEMKGSVSWRVTAPLRTGKQLRSGVRRRLGKLKRALR